MPEKMGNGGHGNEPYNEENGQYIKDGSSGSKVSWLSKKSAPGSAENQISNSEQVKNKPSVSWLTKKPKELPEIVPTDFIGITPLNEHIEQKFEDYKLSDYIKYLLAEEGEFDKELLDQLSEEQVKTLAIAKANSLESPLSEEQIFKQVNDEFKTKIKELDSETEHSLWKFNVPSDVQTIQKGLPLKQQYFLEKLDNLEFGDPQIEEIKKQLEKIDKMLPICDEWVHAKDMALVNNNFSENNASHSASKKLVEKYTSRSNLYSAFAKNHALWCKTYHDAYKNLSAKANEDYNKIDPSDLQAVKNYTSSYHAINEPLRKMTYSGGKMDKSEFTNNVMKMTRAIDVAKTDINMWVQRGVGQLLINDNLTIGYGTDDETLQSLKNVTFKDHGFVSTSAHKGGGFGGNITMNIYMPKGTHALYVDPISHYHGGNEDEMIIQRGYSYKITKVEKKYGHIYLDCEVCLGTDSEKYNVQDLDQLKEKYFN